MDSFQHEIPKSRVSITLDLHTGGAQKKVELPLKLLVAGDFSAGREQAPLAERKKTNIDKNNFDAVLADYAPDLKIAAQNTLADDGSELPVNLSFRSMKDFEPEHVARQIPQLRAMLAMRNLLRDLKSNLLDNVAFRREFEKVLKDQRLSDALRSELAQIATAATQPEGHA
jgi:type VI secretion system protein ImpB